MYCVGFYGQEKFQYRPSMCYIILNKFNHFEMVNSLSGDSLQFTIWIKYHIFVQRGAFKFRVYVLLYSVVQYFSLP